MNTQQNKCSFGDVVIKPDGENELDPCIYKEIETVENCTVHVLQCKKCGHIEIMWDRVHDDDDSDGEES